MTAAQAIHKECRACTGNARSKCISATCKLRPENFKYRSSVKRIAAHCRECAISDSGRSLKAVKYCTGQLLRENGNGKMCWLHPFRMGKNPNRPKRASLPQKFAHETPVPMHFRRVESAISSEVGQQDGGRL